jgi:hypothetical protein
VIPVVAVRGIRFTVYERRRIMTIIETIHARKSCRTYDEKPIDPVKLEELRSYTESSEAPIFGAALRFRLVGAGEEHAAALNKSVTYGLVSGARHFIIGAVAPGPKAMEDFGYCLEKRILRATKLGLGTCIMGGTFRRGPFADEIGLTEEELLPAVSPVGYPRARQSMRDGLFKTIAGSAGRKPWKDMFFLGDTGAALERNDAGPYAECLECVRLAPSALNRQPWRIIKDKRRNDFHFYLKRTPGYRIGFGKIELQNVDMGIALCHFELSARELGLEGAWAVNEPTMRPRGLEYTATWIDGGR